MTGTPAITSVTLRADEVEAIASVTLPEPAPDDPPETAIQLGSAEVDHMQPGSV